jgi:hypothetical protein
MANTPIEEKMKMISDMLDVMPDNIDMDLVCEKRGWHSHPQSYQ